MGAALPLLLVLLAGLLAQSRPVAVAAGTLLLLHLTGFTEFSALLGRWGLPAGWALLAAAALAPLATGPASFSLSPLLSPLGLAAFAAGLLGTCLAQRGLLFLRAHPDLILAVALGFLGALLSTAPPWPSAAVPGKAALAAQVGQAVVEARVVGGMALLRAVSGLLEVGAAFLMLRAGKVGPALQLNATLGLIGPAVNLLVCALGLIFVAVRFSLWRTGLVALGVVLVWLGTR
ncbi:MAG: DUF2619 domain-containing protein [Bacillota bacterium]|nr:DUF2619 domain-containing protein [Bacillota bacterium]